MLKGVFSLPGIERVLSSAIHLGHYVSPTLNRLAPLVFNRPSMPRLLRWLGLLAANPVFFEKVLRDWSSLDWGVYLRVMEGLHEHSAAAYLPEVRVPALVTAGTRDLLTPMTVAIRMHHAIAGSDLWLVAGGTHYTPQEFPDVLAQGIERFLRHADPEVFQTT